jgi:hypothetical protein
MDPAGETLAKAEEATLPAALRPMPNGVKIGKGSLRPYLKNKVGWRYGSSGRVFA